MFRIASSTAPRSARRLPPLPGGALGCLVVAAALAAGTPAAAVDGMLEASGSRQEGRSGVEAYRSENLRLRGSVGERIAFSRALWLTIRYGALRETQENRTSISSSLFRKEVQDPYVQLSYQKGDLEAGLYGNARRTDYDYDTQGDTRDEQISGTAFVSYDAGATDLEARLNEGYAERELEERRSVTRDHRLSLAARSRLSTQDRLQYEFSRSLNEARSAGYEAEYRSHNLDYSGRRRFAADRADVALSARYTHLSQDISYGGGAAAPYLSPDWGGYVLDDTPGDLDPLEPAPVQVEAMYDNDRDTPTIIDIGDDAPLVREYGGDYRNLILDFGDVVQMGSAILYVDTVLNFPELMRWEVYVSDDPEGTDWGEPLDATVVTWRWFRQFNGRQGWVFEFPTPLAHRRVKLVNWKLGLTEPRIRVNELEVYGPAGTGTADFTAENSRKRLTGSFGYRLSASTDLSYRGDFWWADYGDSGRRENSAGHFAGVVHNKNGWRLSASLVRSTRRNSSGRDTEVWGQRLGVAQRPRDNVDWRLHYNRTLDTSYNRDQLTNDLTGDVAWHIYPALILNQKVSYAHRRDDLLDLVSSSWVTVTNLRSSPRRSVTVDLRRTDRWVSQEAGSGFTTFNNTEARVSWAVFPRLVYAGRIRYQVREVASWVRRHLVSLTPLPGGSLDVSIYASLNEDTRADTLQRSLGTRAVWRARPTLMLQGGAEITRYVNGVDHSTPTNLTFRGYWTF